MPGAQSVYVVRRFSRADLSGVGSVELAAFRGQASYPVFFFAQAGDALRGGFFVAICPDGTVAGYVLVLKDSEVQGRGWVLSLATHPAYQGRGVARALLIEGEETLRGWGCGEALLTVDPHNAVARRLYARAGYEVIDYEPDHLGPKADRMTMRKMMAGATVVTPVLPAAVPSPLGYSPELLLGEASSSVDFVNVIFTVSLAVLALTVNKLQRRPVVGLFLFIIMMSSFYASVFYAVVAGNVARLGRHREIHRSIGYGNVLSEYFGVYLVVIVFPLVVDVVSNAHALTYLAFGVDVLGFVFYTTSSFDMVSRPLPGRLPRFCFNSTIILLTGGLLVAQQQGARLPSYIIAGVMLAMLTVVASAHLIRGEGK